MHLYQPNRDINGITEMTLLVPVKQGFVPYIGTLTYASRLKLVLDALNRMRVASLGVNSVRPYSDAIDRIRFIHTFQYQPVGETKLILAANFDGPWDPYMRSIWRDLGPLLDLIMCNCEDYPVSVVSSFEEYTNWVHRHELPGGFFYTHSDRTVNDVAYLREVEKITREVTDAKEREKLQARLRVPSPQKDLSKYEKETLTRLGAQVVQALYQLRPMYSVMPLTEARADGEDMILLRATRRILEELEITLREARILTGKSEQLEHQEWPDWARRAISVADNIPLQWFMTAPKEPDGADEAEAELALLEANKSKIQGGILEQYDNALQGCMILLRVRDRDAARAFLKSRPFTSAERENGNTHYENLAITYEGLRRLGLSESELSAFPNEFKQGIESRFRFLGDVFENHPSNWERPAAYGLAETAESDQGVDLSLVDMVVQIRAGAEDAVMAALKEYEQAAEALRILHTQPMFKAVQGVFGFEEGFSQPAVGPIKSEDYCSKVKPGDMILGYRDSFERESDPRKSVSSVMRNGTFMVIRKIKQDRKVFDEFLDESAAELFGNKDCEKTRAEIKGKLMGRMPDGTPLVQDGSKENNEFTFEGDFDGDRCPIHSHIRRANPRARGIHGPVPRIVRRGMSYKTEMAGGQCEEGLMFIAYNSSIASQFEVIQNWMAGANSSDGYSGQTDPFLGVPGQEEGRVFRCIWSDGEVKRFNLDKRRKVENACGEKEDTSIERRLFTRLKWGMYLFVPSIDLIKKGFAQ